MNFEKKIELIDVFLKKYELTIDDLKTKSRKRKIAYYRSIVFVYLSDLHFSNYKTSEFFKKDRTDIYHYRKICKNYKDTKTPEFDGMTFREKARELKIFIETNEYYLLSNENYLFI